VIVRKVMMNIMTVNYDCIICDRGSYYCYNCDCSTCDCGDMTVVVLTGVIVCVCASYDVSYLH